MYPDSIEQTVQNLCAALEEILTSYGYRLTKATKSEATETADQGVSRTYTLASGTRVFILHCNRAGRVDASLRNVEKNDYFFFTHYLKKKTKAEHLSVCPQIPGEVWEDHIARGLNVVEDLVKNDLKDAMLGKTWIEVPFDWSIIGM